VTAITRHRSLPAWGRWILYVVLFVPVSLLVLDLTTTLSTVGYPECDEPGDACSQEYVGWFLGLLAMAVLMVCVVVGEIVTAVRHFRRRRNA
jgi:heme/copper-type cytochrome/quinol oxidase subunit 2